MFKLDYFTQKLIRKKHVNKENLRVFKKIKYQTYIPGSMEKVWVKKFTIKVNILINECKGE